MRITANQVTMARIFLMPVPVSMLIYGDKVSWWIAFGLFVILGATDFVDGLMARREGPTKLGSLIDPVADKIFMVAILLSLIAIGVFPAWVVSVLLSRELLMTALRSSVANRNEAIKTSVLGKMKTIIQMGGCGTIFLSLVLDETSGFIVCLSLAAPFLLVALVYLLKKKSPPFWSVPVGLAFLMVALLFQFFSKNTTIMVQVSIIIAITWASAIDYLVGTVKLFKKSGMIAGDFIRLFWVIVYGVLVTPLVAYFPITVLPILVSLAMEFGLGGIDNMVVLEKKNFKSTFFLLSSTFGLIFALWMNLAIYLNFMPHPFKSSLVLAVLSSVICLTSFVKNWDLFKRALS